MRYIRALAALSASLFSLLPIAAHADTDVALRYDSHLSKKSDVGGDFKDGSLAWQSADGTTWALGFRAASPPSSTTPAGVQQKDTFQVYAAFSERRTLAPDWAAGCDFQVGQLNGFAVSWVRNSIDAVHRWEGIADSRHSPLTTERRTLVQGTGSLGKLLSQGKAGSQEWRLTGVASLTAGTAQVSGTAGLVASLGPVGANNPLPNARLPGVTDTPTRYLGGYLGLYAQSTAYDLETQYAQRSAVFTYARAGWTVGLGKHGWAKVELSKDLTPRMAHQVTEEYPYLNLQAGLRF